MGSSFEPTNGQESYCLKSFNQLAPLSSCRILASYVAAASTGCMAIALASCVVIAATCCVAKNVAYCVANIFCIIFWSDSKTIRVTGSNPACGAALEGGAFSGGGAACGEVHF